MAYPVFTPCEPSQLSFSNVTEICMLCSMNMFGCWPCALQPQDLLAIVIAVYQQESGSDLVSSVTQLSPVCLVTQHAQLYWRLYAVHMFN